MEKMNFDNPILTIVIPSYNTQKFLKEYPAFYVSNDIINKIQILLIDDGSTDNTKKEAEKLSILFPDFFDVISKKNGGHGSVINFALPFIKGRYFKVIDGDDSIDISELVNFISFLADKECDIVITNFERVYTKEKKVELVECNRYFSSVDYEIPKDKMSCFYLQLHSLTYLTSFWRYNKIILLENVFYEDQEYVLFPLKYAKSFLFYNRPCYRYSLEIENQSVSLSSQVNHKIDREKVCYDILRFEKENREIIPIFRHTYLSFLSTVIRGQYGAYLALYKGKERRKKLIELDLYLKSFDYSFYKLLNQFKLIKILRKTSFRFCGFTFWLEEIKNA